MFYICSVLRVLIQDDAFLTLLPLTLEERGFVVEMLSKNIICVRLQATVHHKGIISYISTLNRSGSVCLLLQYFNK